MKNFFTGEWKLVSVRSETPEHNWQDERVVGGSAFYSQDRMMAFLKTDQMAFAYTARYEYGEGKMKTWVEVSSFDAIDGGYAAREVVEEGPNRFRMVTPDPATGLRSEVIWERRTP